MRRNGIRGLGLAAGLLVLSACQVPPPEPREISSGHVGAPPPAAPVAPEIPEPVKRTPIVPVPQPAAAPVETYTVVVNEVPVKELLFALARDAAINVDVDPGIDGVVTINAVDQTLNQILDRISRQISIRYRNESDTLVIEPDKPFLRIYKIDYLNMARDTSSNIAMSTQIETSSGGETTTGGTVSNTSTTSVTADSNHRLWETITATVRAIIMGDPESQPAGDELFELDAEQIVLPNPETGVLVVRATSRQHEIIQGYLDRVLGNAKRQVLIEATVVEVELSDRYRAGIDWQKFATGAGIALNQSLIAGSTALATAPFFALTYSDAIGGSTATTTQDISLSVRLLKEFGNTRVLSSPKLMVLNNHTATLKAVDNVVFFDIESEVVVDVNGNPIVSTTSQAQTVPEGFVMAVTPQVGDGDEVTLNVRPTITRVTDFVADPAIQPSEDPAAPAPVPNLVPQIRVRELESMLRLNSGQIAILGGLMQDNVNIDTSGVPVLSDVEEFGDAFRSRDNNFIKTELVIFMRTTVIRTPSVDADLSAFQRFLPENIEVAEPIPPVRSEAPP